MKRVYLVPGFLASDLTRVADNLVLWWDVNLISVAGSGGLRLAPNGIDPGPPDGVQLGVNQVAQNPWPTILTQLGTQLGRANWSVEVDSFDWRKDLGTTATNLAAVIRGNSSAAEPATIVGHSAGGLIACLVWARLKATGEENKIRRIISICSPFQGSYAPIEWLTGNNVSVQQLLLFATGLTPFGVPFLSFGQSFLNALALTWPSFYELMPSVVGSEAVADPNRQLLYSAANYPQGLAPDQTWLTFAKNGFQPGMAGIDTFPPDYVFTCVISNGFLTSRSLNVANVPLALGALGQTMNGDGVVTAGSQTRTPGQQVFVFGSHASVPLGITATGLLAQLITDPRGPLSPPPPSDSNRGFYSRKHERPAGFGVPDRPAMPVRRVAHRARPGRSPLHNV